ncbi:isoprenylcysteine carboxyl methyltransferase [Rhizoctonia solani]|uniref:Protein-S-isoprenylcysteine O-methyltransferase n=1 Tax=Rhizoctonia solani TaxID=456999 RepID=A0A8H8T1X0_9AGAM|nr:isoprenylcysteine carboxyl methyltransferase [Rhizoctonia solani]QRW25212.1 isoprenylcysteine carboxyl methyltransferase [Rhizoctonia solani]
MIIYIAGLHISISQTQALNAAGWASIIYWFNRCLPSAHQRAQIEKEAGAIKAMPPGKQGQSISVIHGLGLFVPIAAFVFTLPFTGFRVPGWLSKTSLPPIESNKLYIGLRLGACAATFVGVYGARLTFKHLGSQWGAIGVRERPKIVKTGPYALVRHPGYFLAMSEQLILIPMFWNWVFAPALVLTSIAFAIKMPMEEKVIEENAEIGEAYRQYKKEVPYRIIPYVW